MFDSNFIAEEVMLMAKSQRGPQVSLRGLRAEGVAGRSNLSKGIHRGEIKEPWSRGKGEGDKLPRYNVILKEQSD